MDFSSYLLPQDVSLSEKLFFQVEQSETFEGGKEEPRRAEKEALLKKLGQGDE